MPSPENREARQQAQTRTINEWIEDANESMGIHAGTDPYRCECGDSGCADAIDLTRAEYEALRSYPARFAIAANHESPSDTVVAEHERYSIVEKLVGRLSRHAYRTYPR